MSSRKDGRGSFDEHDRAGKRRSRVVDDVVPRGISRKGGFRRDRRIYRTYVCFRSGFRGVSRVTRKRDEPNRGEYGEYRYDDDEFRESKTSKQSLQYFFDGHGQLVIRSS